MLAALESVARRNIVCLVEMFGQNLHSHRQPRGVVPQGTLMQGMPARPPVIV